MESIVVSIRKHGRAFAIHKQPENWFRRGREDGITICIINMLGYMYHVYVCEWPELRPDMCYVARSKGQLGMEFDYSTVGEHQAWVKALRRAITALVNIARQNGYEFRIIP